MAVDLGLRFWVDFVDAEGGAAEPGGDSTLVLLPQHLCAELGLPEELLVTDDPDVAEEDGALLIIPGQPVLVGAAEMVLRRGEGGWCHLPWPASKPPTLGALKEAAREQVGVDHGRVDLLGQPAARYLPVLRVGALVDYRIALGDRFLERLQVFVDGRDGSLLPDPMAEALDRLATLPGPGSEHSGLPPDLERALAAADAWFRRCAQQRQAELAHDARGGRDGELARVAAYYDAVLDSIDKRARQAADDKVPLYQARAEATRAERARRAQETEDKFAGRHVIRPFRLQAIAVPALVVEAVVRRGPRSFDLRLEWLWPFGAWRAPICPSCGSPAPLVAGRDRLGCRTCL